jgi:hypothetical protein
MGPGCPHTAWQPIFTSFINSWKAGGSASTMTPAEGQPYAVGAIWYRTILMDRTCSNDDGSTDSKTPELTYEKLDGFDAGQDAINWAFILTPGISSEGGYTIRIINNEVVLTTQDAVDGLNAGYTVGTQPGNQRVELVDPSGLVVAAAIGAVCVSTACPDTIYNMKLPGGFFKGKWRGKNPVPF